MEQQFIKRLKRYQPSVRTLNEYVAREYGEAVRIDIDVYEGLVLFEPLSMGRQRDLSRDIYEFIDEKVYPIPLKYPVTLRFCGGPPMPEEKDRVRSALKEHYDLRLLDKALDLKLNAVKIAALSLIGVLLLSAWFTAQRWSSQPIFTEILSIAGTFSLWEAVGLYLLERRELKLAKLNAAQAAMSEVVFDDGPATPPRH